MRNPRTQPGTTFNLKINERELATVLSALRIHQDGLKTMGVATMAKCDPEHFHNFAPLTATQIDELCERLNFE